MLNASKTKTLLVTGEPLAKRVPDKVLKLSCNGRKFEQATSQKLLRLKLDINLNFY